MKPLSFAALFLIFSSAFAIVLIPAVLAMEWQWRSQIESSLNASDQRRLDKMLPRLSKAFQRLGTWERIRIEPYLWERLVDSTLPKQKSSVLPEPKVAGQNHHHHQHNHERKPDDPFAGQEPLDNQDHFTPDSASPTAASTTKTSSHPPHGHAMRRDPTELAERIRLLDSERRSIAGPAMPAEPNDERFIPIKLKGQIVGWVALRPPSTLIPDPLIQPSDKRNLSYVVIGLSVLVMSITLATFFTFRSRQPDSSGPSRTTTPSPSK